MKGSLQLVSLLLSLIKEIIVIKRYLINIGGYHPFVLKVQIVKKLLTVLIFWLGTSAWAGDFEDGVVAYRKGDYKTAFSFHKKAAEQGHSDSQFNLGVMYGKGEGVLQDYLQAHMWWNLAATSGEKAAHQSRDSVARKMTLQQIAKAQAMAKKCLASQYKDCD